MLRKSRILRNNRSRRVSFSAKVNLLDAKVVELFGLMGYDAVWICLEHTENDLANVAGQVRAAKLHDMDTIVRIASGGYTDVIRPLELDVTGIMVPHVSTVAEGRRAIEMARFAPIGKRRVDGGNADSNFYSVSMDEYRSHANTEKIVILQIESPEGVANVEEIAKLAGFDAILFGPTDFSQHIGRFGEIASAEVQAVEHQVVRAALRYGKIPMITGTLEPRNELFAAGSGIINVGYDLGWLRESGARALQRNRAESGWLK